MLLGHSATDRLGSSRVLVAGLGGTGGGLAVLLARMGVGTFVLADPGTFDRPDMNRQWAARSETIGQNKAEVYGQVLPRVVPGVEVEVHPEGVTDRNVEALVARADLVCDCLDVKVDPQLRARLFGLARAKGVYATSCPIVGFGTAFAASAPDGVPMDPFLDLLERVLVQKRFPSALADVFDAGHLSRIEECVRGGTIPSVAIATTCSAAVSATEIALILTKGALEPWRPPLVLPQMAFLDAFGGRYVTKDVHELLQ
jgi:hypothetical protein